MKKLLMVALIASAVMIASVPEVNAGPIRNLIARITNRPKPTPPAPAATSVAYVPQTTYVASCAGCQGNWASGGTCSNGSCTK